MHLFIKLKGAPEEKFLLARLCALATINEKNIRGDIFPCYLFDHGDHGKDELYYCSLQDYDHLAYTPSLQKTKIQQKNSNLPRAFLWDLLQRCKQSQSKLTQQFLFDLEIDNPQMRDILTQYCDIPENLMPPIQTLPLQEQIPDIDMPPTLDDALPRDVFTQENITTENLTPSIQTFSPQAQNPDDIYTHQTLRALLQNYGTTTKNSTPPIQAQHPDPNPEKDLTLGSSASKSHSQQTTTICISIRNADEHKRNKLTQNTVELFIQNTPQGAEKEVANELYILLTQLKENNKDIFRIGRNKHPVTPTLSSPDGPCLLTIDDKEITASIQIWFRLRIKINNLLAGKNTLPQERKKQGISYISIENLKDSSRKKLSEVKLKINSSFSNVVQCLNAIHDNPKMYGIKKFQLVKRPNEGYFFISEHPQGKNGLTLRTWQYYAKEINDLIATNSSLQSILTSKTQEPEPMSLEEKENLEENSGENLEENSGENLEENLEENSGENLEENLEENSGENLEENLEENSGGNLEDPFKLLHTSPYPLFGRSNETSQQEKTPSLLDEFNTYHLGYTS